MQQESVEQMCAKIKNEAETEAEGILCKAKSLSDQRIKLAKQQADNSCKKIIAKAQKQSEGIKNKISSFLEHEKHKIILFEQERLISKVYDSLETEIEKFIGSAKYLKFLKDSLIEGVLALGSAEIIVSIGEKDSVTTMEGVLEEVQKEFKKLGDRKISFNLDDLRHSDYGVKLSNKDRRIHIDNTLRQRLKSKESEIRNFLFKKLFD